MKMHIVESFAEFDVKLKVSKGTRVTVSCVDFYSKKHNVGGVILTDDMDKLCAAWSNLRKQERKVKRKTKRVHPTTKGR